MNALDLLRNDHQRILNLFQQVHERGSATEQESQPGLEDISRAIHVHQKMVRDILYPELEGHSQGPWFILSQSKADRELEEMVDTKADQASKRAWTQRRDKLRDLWLDHIERSEMNLFPEVERLLGPGKLLELFYEMDEIRTH